MLPTKSNLCVFQSCRAMESKKESLVMSDEEFELE